MLILEDTRQQASKHETKHKWFSENGIKVERCRLYVGDYTLPTNQSVCIDTKKDLQELVQDICQQHDRFRNELIRAKEAGIQLVILCEHGGQIKCLEDVYFWSNPRKKVSPKAMDGWKLFKVLNTMKDKYGVRFEFCDKRQTGKRIVEILNNGNDG
jgi:ERCC4-type nuclease